MGKIILEKNAYTFDQILKGNWEEGDAYFSEVLLFCQSWLQGQDSFLLQTSGSTGIPKTIAVDRGQMEISVAATGKFFGIAKNPRLLCCLNIQMIAGKMMLVRAMVWDADLIVTKPKENPFEEEWVDGAFDFVAMVPMQVASCLSQNSSLQKLKKIKTLVIGGAPSPKSLLEKISSEKIPAYQTYGMTETVSHIALAKIAGTELVFETLPGVSIGADPDKRLWIEAPMAKEKRLQTNDLVDILDEKHFMWIGRSDFTINSGGFKIQPEILENQIAPTIESYYGKVPFFLFGLDDEKLGQKLALVIEHPILDNPKKSNLLHSISQIVDKYQIPKELIFVREFVKTPSGKINKSETIKSAR
ncbi:AMP-binding protein [Aquiflexum sp. LQ15W]|uniref:AMP-binding protein n=1 Tax=Cognataquiflexum nitidum TaxID=2922272 RepID=UPI001F141B50|nr:AMP-binding protein [Cognataquiflexum nitidum]MCH6201606.1 AMP-binding protein [Cognataquiflexum nitidum]